MLIQVHQCSPSYHPVPMVSWLIKYFSKTNYSHYAIQCNNIVIDATGQDVLPQSTYSFTKKYRIEKSFKIDIDSTFEEFVNWALLFISKKYGYWQIFGLLLMLAGIFKNNPWGKDSERMICNELVLYLLKDFKGFKPRDTDNYNLVQTEKILSKYAI